MRKIIFALIFGIFLLSSCMAGEHLQQSNHIMDALQIRAWVLDESIEGNVYHQHDSVYVFERLNINEVKLMTPLNFQLEEEGFNPVLSIFVEFNGIIEVVAENEDVALFVNNNRSAGFGEEGVWGFSVKFALEGFFNAIVMTDEDARTGVSPRGYFGHAERVGTERYLTIKAYSFDNEETPIITARLRLVLIEDWEEDMWPLTGDGLSKRCFSIELISYDMPDIYRIIYEVYD